MFPRHWPKSVLNIKTTNGDRYHICNPLMILLFYFLNCFATCKMMENNGNKLIACINKMYLIRTVLRVFGKISILFASWEVIDAEQIKK